MGIKIYKEKHKVDFSSSWDRVWRVVIDVGPKAKWIVQVKCVDDDVLGQINTWEWNNEDVCPPRNACPLSTGVTSLSSISLRAKANMLLFFESYAKCQTSLFFLQFYGSVFVPEWSVNNKHASISFSLLVMTSSISCWPCTIFSNNTITNGEGGIKHYPIYVHMLSVLSF